MMKPPFPRRVAYCWNYGRELTRKDMERIGCTDLEKQHKNMDGACKWLQLYGDAEKEKEWRAMRERKTIQQKKVTMQELYNTIADTLEQNGVRLEGSRINLVQELPNGSRMRLWLDDAEKARNKVQGCEVS